MAARGYKTKKALKASIGEVFHYTETSIFSDQHRDDGEVTVVGPAPYERKWYAQVTCKDGLIVKVT